MVVPALQGRQTRMKTQHTPGPWRVERQNPSPTTGEWMIAGEVRTDQATQKEHRLMAESVHDLLKAQLPAVFV